MTVWFLSHDWTKADIIGFHYYEQCALSILGREPSVEVSDLFCWVCAQEWRAGHSLSFTGVDAAKVNTASQSVGSTWHRHLLYFRPSVGGRGISLGFRLHFPNDCRCHFLGFWPFR